MSSAWGYGVTMAERKGLVWWQKGGVGSEGVRDLLPLLPQLIVLPPASLQQAGHPSAPHVLPAILGVLQLRPNVVDGWIPLRMLWMGGGTPISILGPWNMSDVVRAKGEFWDGLASKGRFSCPDVHDVALLEPSSFALKGGVQPAASCDASATQIIVH
eukprot:RCo019150